MTFDLIMLGVFLVFCVWGFFSVLTTQIMRLFMMLMAYFGCSAFGGPLGGLIANQFSLHRLVGHAIGNFVGFLLLFLVLSTAGWFLIGKIQSYRNPDLPSRDVWNTYRNIWHRLAGVLLGLVMGVITVFLLLCVFRVAETKYQQSLCESGLGYHESHLMSIARKNQHWCY